MRKCVAKRKNLKRYTVPKSNEKSISIGQLISIIGLIIALFSIGISLYISTNNKIEVLAIKIAIMEEKINYQKKYLENIENVEQLSYDLEKVIGKNIEMINNMGKAIMDIKYKLK